MSKKPKLWIRLILRATRSVSLAAAVGGLASLALNAVITDYSDTRSKLRDDQNDAISKLREKQLEQLTAFAFADDEVSQKSRDLITAMLDKKPINKSALALSSEISKQIQNAEKLKGAFSSSDIDTKIENYQNALQQFLDSLEEFQNPSKMKNWKLSFGKVIDTKNELKASLFKIVRPS
ncbi:hypothetical protein [Methylobacterium sp. Leaf93]|uniref:hypothetical protein n=1 Tax=Methylobacterium sp. Leaf93 TaxID=1736249 RepID=UPI001AEC600C|nr:hypothetical protein [Methylobacterium sp. Leaf93]